MVSLIETGTYQVVHCGINDYKLLTTISAFGSQDSGYQNSLREIWLMTFINYQLLIEKNTSSCDKWPSWFDYQIHVWWYHRSYGTYQVGLARKRDVFRLGAVIIIDSQTSAYIQIFDRVSISQQLRKFFLCRFTHVPDVYTKESLKR